MADTKQGREDQAADEDRRQRERAMDEALARADEPEPALDDVAEGDQSTDDEPPECHRRDCHEPAAFVVIERYQEDTGHGAVEAKALLCREHTAEERPTNLEGVYADYLFGVTPLPGSVPTDPSHRD